MENIDKKFRDQIYFAITKFFLFHNCDIIPILNLKLMEKYLYPKKLFRNFVPTFSQDKY